MNSSTRELVFPTFAQHVAWWVGTSFSALQGWGLEIWHRVEVSRGPVWWDRLLSELLAFPSSTAMFRCCVLGVTVAFCRRPWVPSSPQGFGASDLEQTGHSLPAQPLLHGPRRQARFQNYSCASGQDEVLAAQGVCRYFESGA